ncbi:hypothetical protein D3H65_05045 [Paraflavitalea soli]|uniref:Anti-sigma K factor RskA C-terminal domain-containing protein n=1 Tax=Paraflavitalea soli TaxID=2315862 RepID=A0A3B7MGA8_9BACT|nr:anti-sigma factor [Paraflavitalea soli]AXY73382.1 hypothetical protein D3H65_05045 [Paraflavitalea soli]
MDIQAYIQSGVIESYVLGIANNDEVAELQRLRLEHPAIDAAVVQAEEWLRNTAPQFAVPVAGNAKEQLMATLQQEFSTSAPEITTTSIPPAPVVQMGTRYIAAASLILFMASAGVNVYLYKKYTKANRDYLALQNEHNNLLADNKIYQTRLTDLHKNMQLMAAPGMLKVSMPGIAGKENNLATVYWDSHTKNVYLIASNLPPAPAGKQYQLWALVDGKPVDAGMLDNCTVLCQLKPVQHAQAFAITLEKAGGNSVPDLTQLYVMGKVPS